MTRLPPSPTLFPYPTLFRSGLGDEPALVRLRGVAGGTRFAVAAAAAFVVAATAGREESSAGRETARCHRSEEHTSELQSLTNLVCRLLLENKIKCLRHERLR